ncbi:MAG: LacI family DNA-binding transcriptional regulator [Microbacterium enclense]
MRAGPRTVTIYDVAEKAGVSISTVSLVMNAPHRVAAATRERVVAAAAALGYRSRSTPSSRATNTVRVAVAAPFASYPSYLRRLAGMMERARSRAVDLVPYDLPSAAAAEHPLLDALPTRPGIDALIVMGVPLGGSALRASRAARLPVVLVDVRRRRAAAGEPPHVLVDDVLAGRLLGEHLAGLGHRRALFLHDPQRSSDYVSAGMLRYEGLSEFLTLDRLAAGTSDRESRLIDHLRRGATAVIGSHDGLSARAWGILLAAGMRIPDDVSLVGFDDGDVAAALELTTVHQPFEETGAAALDIALSLASGRDSAVGHIELEPSLVVRRSAREPSGRSTSGG